MRVMKKRLLGLVSLCIGFGILIAMFLPEWGWILGVSIVLIGMGWLWYLKG